jgi:hypothetical protein
MTTDFMAENTDNSSDGGSIWSFTGRRRAGSMSSAATTDYGFEIDPFHIPSSGPDVEQQHANYDASSSADVQMTSHSDWGTSMEHRRARSDARSEVSFTHNSPYLGKVEDNDQPKYSPPLPAQHGHNKLDEVMDLGSFSFGDYYNLYVTSL